MYSSILSVSVVVVIDTMFWSIAQLKITLLVEILCLAAMDNRGNMGRWIRRKHC